MDSLMPLYMIIGMFCAALPFFLVAVLYTIVEFIYKFIKNNKN